MKKLILLYIILSVFSDAVLVNAELINLPIINADAETGDLSGWNIGGVGLRPPDQLWLRPPPDTSAFQAKYDPINGIEGNYYFEIDPSVVNNSAFLTQTFDISQYSNTLQNIRLSAMTKSTDGIRVGYDEDYLNVKKDEMGHLL